MWMPWHSKISQNVLICGYVEDIVNVLACFLGRLDKLGDR